MAVQLPILILLRTWNGINLVFDLFLVLFWTVNNTQLFVHCRWTSVTQSLLWSEFHHVCDVISTPGSSKIWNNSKCATQMGAERSEGWRERQTRGKMCVLPWLFVPWAFNLSQRQSWASLWTRALSWKMSQLRTSAAPGRSTEHYVCLEKCQQIRDDEGVCDLPCARLGTDKNSEKKHLFFPLLCVKLLLLTGARWGAISSTTALL